MATTSAVPAPAITGVVIPASTPVPAPRKSFIKRIGSDFKAVFSFLGKPKVQAAILAGEALGEAVVDTANPGLIGLNPIIDAWTKEIFKTQALAAAAGQADGNGAQKAAMVISSVTPQVLQFAEANKMPVPTGDRLLQANTLLYNFLEILGGGDPANAPTA